MKALRITGFILDKTWRIALAGLLIVGHFVMNIVGIIIGVVSQG